MNKRKIPIEWIISGGLFIFLCTIALLTDTTGDSGDSIMHFLFSKYAMDYPHFFLHHWAKPVFVLLSFPFSQFGFNGIEIFNSLCASLSTLFTFYVARNLGLKKPYLVFIFIFFAPLYSKLIFSGLTEYLFGFILILAIYLSTEKKLFPASILISFLPLVRSEGLIVIGIFALFLLFHRKYKLLPLLLTGQLIYSFAGALYYEDILWVFRKIPYVVPKNAYGHGHFYDFIIRLKYVIEVPLGILFSIGTATILVKSSKEGVKKLISPEVFLILGTALGILISHTVFWWFGLFGSFGLPRVLIPIVPLIAIIALNGFNTLRNISLNRKINQAILVLTLACVCLYPFTLHREKSVTFGSGIFEIPENQLVKEEIKPFLAKLDSVTPETLFFYSHPNLSLFLNVDHFDTSRRKPLESILNQQIPKGSIIIWDNWFSVVEEGIPIKKITHDKRLKPLKTFSRKHKSQNIRYEVFRFEEE